MQFLVPSGQEPVTWWKGKPVYLTIILILAHGAALLMTTAALAVRAEGLINAVIFSAAGLLRGELWRFPSRLRPRR